MTTPDDPSRATAPMTAVLYAETCRLAIQLADSYVLAGVRQMAVPTSVAGSSNTWYDTQPMLSMQERSAESVDKCRAALAYGEYRRILARHPEKHHLVRFVNPA